VNLNEAVRGIDKMLAHAAGENVDVTFELARGPLLTRLEPTHLELTLLRIVRHAREAMESTGRIVVRTSGHPLEWLPGQATIELSVTGRWSDPSLSAVPYDRGLRLSTVESLVSRYDGTMSLEAAVEGGTTVRLVFPKAIEER
jgi:signal transduction histidine kinase